MKKVILIILAIVIVMIGIFIKSYNPVINESVLKANKAKFLKDGIIEINPSVTNCFLIKNEDKYVLIDTVYEHEWDSLSRELEASDIQVSDISHIIVTHHHDDHVGLLNELTTKNPDIKVVMSSLTKDLILQGENDRNHNGGFVNKRVRLIKVIKNKFDKNWNELKFTPYHVRENDILISEDTSLGDIGIELDGKIIKTPGHSKDSISIVLDNGYAFVGDAAANMPIFQLVGANYFVIVLEDINQYYESWEKLIQSGAKQILPSHGNAFEVDKLKENMWKNKKEDIVSNK